MEFNPGKDDEPGRAHGLPHDLNVCTLPTESFKPSREALRMEVHSCKVLEHKVHSNLGYCSDTGFDASDMLSKAAS